MSIGNPEQPITFVQKLEDRKATKDALLDMFNAGYIQGTYEDMVPLVTRSEDETAILNLTAEYIELKSTKNLARARAVAKQIEVILNDTFDVAENKRSEEY